MENNEYAGCSGGGLIPPSDSIRHVKVADGLFLFERGERINIRLLCSDDKAVNCYVDDKDEVEQRIAEIDAEEIFKATWVQLQVLNPDTQKQLTFGKAVRREHIARYRWFVVDIDALRPNKSATNATDEEKKASLITAKEVRSFLRGTGWPESAFCDSGNGWHLVWRVDLPNAPENFDLLRSCLVALATKFNNQAAEIDTTLAEPEQVIKLWGTMTRKGENTPERPWRRSCVVSVPREFTVVAPELLRALAADAPVQRCSGSRRGGKYPEVCEDFEPEDFFEWCQENLPVEYQEFFLRDSDADRDDADGHHYVMDGCFWSERKHSGDRRKTEFILGRTFGFKCFSDDCDGVRIGDILRKVTKLAGKPYPGQIFAEDESIFDGVEYLDGNEQDEDERAEEERLECESTEDAPQAGSNVPQPVSIMTAGDPLEFPETAMYGKLGDMAVATRMPLGLGYPAVLGVYSVVPNLDEMDDTRINNYVILLAPPGGGKNQAIKRALVLIDLPKEHYKKSAPVSDRGLMQLVGHRVEKKRGGEEKVTPGPRKLLLVTNEAANVLKKANIKNSSLGATLCELWDENEYAPADRSGEHGCIDELGFQNPKEVHIGQEACAMLENLTDLDEEEEGRLKYCAKKVALLTAAADGESTVGVECMNAAIEFAKWQGRLREVFTIGVAAENSLEAQFTEALLGALRQRGGEEKFIAWRRLAHDRKWEERFGPRVVNSTVKALVESGTLQVHTYVAKNDDGRNVVKEDPNKVKLSTWK